MMRIKICGLTNAADYRLAVELGADYAGFIFHSDSPRYVNADEVRRMILSGPIGKQRKVGVFVNAPATEIRSLFHYAGLDLVQLHGDESPQFCRSLGLPYWKALRPRSREDLQRGADYDCPVLLLDSFTPGLYGGSGASLAEEILAQLANCPKAMILAGGISADNLRSFLRLQPFGLDVCSSIEERPGKKNPAALRAFFQEFQRLTKEKQA